jgi:hypothetical protein
MKKTYTGGCHCGAVRYEADLDLTKGTVKCNCSICTKGRTWFAAAEGDEFRLLRGAESLGRYEFGSHRIHHLFCKQCGIKSFARGEAGGGKQFVAVILTCLENIPDAQFAELQVHYVDGRHDNFQAAPAVTSYL